MYYVIYKLQGKKKITGALKQQNHVGLFLMVYCLIQKLF